MAGPLRKLCIVRRDEPHLYENLVGQFAGDTSVHVIIDRRVGERRQRQETPSREWRQADRRRRHAIDAQLRTVGHALVELEDEEDATESLTATASAGVPQSAVTADTRRRHRCPSCGSGSILRDAGSSRSLGRALLRLVRRRAYLCLDCGRRFYDRPVSRDIP